VAWPALCGEAGAIAGYLAEARAAGVTCALISSEELDYVLHVPAMATRIEAEARAAGATEIIWAAALRRPSEAFRSHISELTKHGIHLDPLQGYLEIRRTGGLHFTGRLNGGTQFWNWFFTFDYVRYITRLRATLTGHVLTYDYHAEDRLPGAPVLRAAAAGADGLIAGLTAPGRINARLDPPRIADNIAGMLSGYGHSTAETEALLAAMADRMRLSGDAGIDRILDAGLDHAFGDYASVLGGGPAVPQDRRDDAAPDIALC